MGLTDRIFLGASAVALASAVAFGGFWERQLRPGAVAPGASGPTDEIVQQTYSEALDLVAANYAGKYEVEGVTKAAIQGMLRTLDPHSTFFDSREFSELKNEQQSQLIGIGVTINQRNGRVYVLSAIPESPAEKAGLRYGDAIVAIDRKPTADWTYPQVIGGVRGERGKTVEITVERVGAPEPITYSITRDAVPLPTIRNYFMISPSVGYVGLTAGFSSTTDAELGRAILDLKSEGMQQLVLDLRSNPGGLLDEAIKVAQRFLPTGQEILVVRARSGGARQERVFKSQNDDPEAMPLVVLIDGGSASASEVVTGALQDHDRALVVGETSFGKGLVQTVFDLNFETGLTLTTAKYFTPTGRSIQRDYSRVSFYDYMQRHGAEEPEEAGQGEALLTDLGRRVYGGGGITPDIRLAGPNGTPLRARLFGAAFEFSRHLVAGQVPGLREFRVDTVDYGHRLRGDEYRITDRVIDAFREFAAGRSEFALTDAQITANVEYVRNRIREEIITAAYGTEAGNQFFLLNDTVTQRAVDALPQARELADNARASRDRQ